MKLFGLYFLTTILSVRSAPQHSVYDQKQTGEYNIQVHLKDFQIIALLGDEALGDYDYNYDYSDFTVKPPSNSTIRTTTTTTSASSTQAQISTTRITPSTTIRTEPEPEKTSTEKVEVSFSTSAPDRIKVQIIEDANPSSAPAEDATPSSSPALGEVLHYKRCASGYARDKRGRCRRVRRPQTAQFDIGRLASTLAARFRASSEDDSTSDSSGE